MSVWRNCGNWKIRLFCSKQFKIMSIRLNRKHANEVKLQFLNEIFKHSSSFNLTWTVAFLELFRDEFTNREIIFFSNSAELCKLAYSSKLTQVLFVGTTGYYMIITSHSSLCRDYWLLYVLQIIRTVGTLHEVQVSKNSPQFVILFTRICVFTWDVECRRILGF